ncbi:MAG: trypsin-like peptidase domain-containing protein [Capsulimonadaceae bacterium]
MPALKAFTIATVTLVLCSLLQPTLATPTPPPAVQPATATGTLHFRVVIIDDLIPKPVPLTDFEIVAADQTVSQTVRTDVNGSFTTQLPAGTYTVVSLHPVAYKGKSYSWKSSVTVTDGGSTTIALTDADAQATEPAAAQEQQPDPGAIYKSLKDGVVTVEGEMGSGTGFIFDKSGLILTNEHVVDGGPWVAVRFERGKRVEARILVADSAADVAVLQTDLSSFPQAVAVPLAGGDEVASVAAGDPVYTIGSPLHQEKILTHGMVSKVETDALISDLNINHGNSGGPVIDSSGKAIGLATFIDAGDPNGPGVSGIVLLTRALPVIARARTVLDTAPAASFAVLPDISPILVPDDDLSTKPYKVKPWDIDAPQNFDTLLSTPFVIAAQNRKAAEPDRRGSDDDGDDSDDADESAPHFWHQYADNDTDPVVMVEVEPQLKEKKSSVKRDRRRRREHRFNDVPDSYEYRDDFYDLVLMRGDQPVPPVRRERTIVQENFNDYVVTAHDAAFGGTYWFDPSAFEPSKPLVIRVWRTAHMDKPDEVKIPTKMQQEIWDQFAKYRAYVASLPSTGTPPASAPASGAAAPAPPATTPAAPASPTPASSGDQDGDDSGN